jgi:hypothetical protein
MLSSHWYRGPRAVVPAALVLVREWCAAEKVRFIFCDWYGGMLLGYLLAYIYNITTSLPLDTRVTIRLFV